MNKEKRDLLISDYVTEQLDGMDHKCLYSLAEQFLTECLADYNDEQLTAEINDRYPHLLED